MNPTINKTYPVFPQALPELAFRVADLELPEEAAPLKAGAELYNAGEPYARADVVLRMHPILAPGSSTAKTDATEALMQALRLTGALQPLLSGALFHFPRRLGDQVSLLAEIYAQPSWSTFTKVVRNILLRGKLGDNPWDRDQLSYIFPGLKSTLAASGRSLAVSDSTWPERPLGITLEAIKAAQSVKETSLNLEAPEASITLHYLPGSTSFDLINLAKNGGAHLAYALISHLPVHDYFNTGNTIRTRLSILEELALHQRGS